MLEHKPNAAVDDPAVQGRPRIDGPAPIHGAARQEHRVPAALPDIAEVPLTPRHSAGLVGMWEKEGVARFGIECYYTGQQRLEYNPYRAFSSPYVIFGAMGERRVAAHVKVFLNLENLGNVRQSRWDPMLLPSRAVDGRWTVDAWAPLDGRVINGGVRFIF